MSSAPRCRPSRRSGWCRGSRAAGAGRSPTMLIAERKAMIDREHDLPVTKQAEDCAHQPWSVYYRARPVSATDLEVMRRLDRLHLEFPFAGSRMLQGLLNADAADGDRGALLPSAYDEAGAGPEDLPVSAARDRDHAAEPGVGDGHHLHPDGARLRLSGCRADWFSRRVLSWRVSITMEAAFCVEALEDALARHSKPEVFNTTRVRSSRARPSPACSPTTVLRSVWTAKGLGGITSSSSGYGAASNTRRCICGPTTASARPALRSAVTSISTVHIRALTARHQIKPTSPRCPSAWQPNPGRGSTYRRGKIVQTTGTSSYSANSRNANAARMRISGNSGNRLALHLLHRLTSCPEAWEPVAS